MKIEPIIKLFPTQKIPSPYDFTNEFFRSVKI